MILIQVPGPIEERLLREALAPLGQIVVTATQEDGAPAPMLAILWGENGAAPLPVARNLMLISAPDMDGHALAPDIHLVLPVRPGEITDRARTFLARAARQSFPSTISLGIYEFLPQENQVHHKITKKILRLTDKERDILLTLHKAGGQPVSRQALLDSVWAYAPDVETHTLETHIYRLRQKIERDPAAPEIVLTDEQGYRILAS